MLPTTPPRIALKSKRPAAENRGRPGAARRRERAGATDGLAAAIRCGEWAPTVLIMAAGQGTRMRSAVPKMLHPVCGRRPGRLADPRRARGRGRAGGGDRLARTATSRARCRRGSRRSSSRSRTGPAARCGRRRGAWPKRDRARPLRRRAADLRRADRRAPRRPRAPGRRGDDADDHSTTPAPTAASSAPPTARGRAGGRGESRPATRPRPSSRSARSTPASTPSTRRPLAAALAELSNDNAQGEYYLPDVCRCCARRAVASPPTLGRPA